MRRLGVAFATAIALAVAAAPSQAQGPYPGYLTFTNAAPITSTGAYGKTSLYPSPVTVTGGTGFLFRINVTLNGVTSPFPGDFDVMLESPNGRKTLLMSDVGGTNDLTNATINITDSSSTPMTTGLLTSTDYQPTNLAGTCPNATGGDDEFVDDPFPATTATFNDFRRAQVNGTWKLWMMDDCNGDAVQINGGWTLRLSTNPDFGVAIPGSGTAGPARVYPIEIPISGRGTAVTKVRAKLDGVNHTQSNDLDMLLVGPTGATTMLMSDIGQGLLENTDSDMEFDDSGPPLPSTALPGSQATDTYRPTNYDTGPDPFPAPAPPGPYGGALAAFNGTNPNGTWKLYAYDDLGGDVGGMQSVTLDITSVTPAGQTETTSQTVRPRARDSFAPVVRVNPGKLPKLGSVLKSGGFRIPVNTSEKSRISAQALVSPPLAKKLKLPPNGKAFTSAKKAKPAIVATGKAAAARAGTVRVKLKLTRKARRALTKRRRRGKGVALDMRIRVTDSVGNRRLAKTKIKLKP
ncbi:MAG TPA: hypothetical protein VEX39_03820 [Thermoleophilaceae bacterium]|nr:hypothetical protein [Thermoleophilaceae bacterium]